LVNNLGWPEIAPNEMLGMDPGVSHLAATSDGEILDALRFYRDAEPMLAQAQRTKQDQTHRRMSRTVARKRNDSLQKISHRLARNNQIIKMGGLPIPKMTKKHKKAKPVTGSVSAKTPAELIVTPPVTPPAGAPAGALSISLLVTRAPAGKSAIILADPTPPSPQRSFERKPSTTPTNEPSSFTPSFGKPLLDQGLGMFRRMLSDKCHRAGRMYHEVDEAHTTMVCPDCDAPTGPYGTAELHIRALSCAGCGVYHHRDVAGAKNVKRIEPGKTLLSSVPRCRELLKDQHKWRREPRSSGSEKRRTPRVRASQPLALPEHGSGA